VTDSHAIRLISPAFANPKRLIRQLRHTIIHICFQILYAFLRLLVPTNPKQFGFLSHPDLSDNSLALFEKLLMAPYGDDYHLVWMVSNASTSRRDLRREFPNTDLRNVSVVTKHSLRGVWFSLRCRYIFTTHGGAWFGHSWHQQTLVNLWHGMPFKNFVAVGDKRDSFPMHFAIATSAYLAGIVAENFNLPRERVLITGQPRNEWLFQQEERYFAVKEGRAKLVVWAPTFRRGCTDKTEILEDGGANSPDPLSADRLTALDEMLEGAGTMLVIKLHVMDIKNQQAWPSYRNIRIYTDPRFRTEGLNLYKLLACSDALVTDFSSCVIDYLILNKPIGLFAPDSSSYARGFIPGVFEKLATVASELRSVAELAAFVSNLPPEHAPTPEQELLYQMDLRSPSEAIMRAIGLPNPGSSMR